MSTKYISFYCYPLYHYRYQLSSRRRAIWQFLISVQGKITSGNKFYECPELSRVAPGIFTCQRSLLDFSRTWIVYDFSKFFLVYCRIVPAIWRRIYKIYISTVKTFRLRFYCQGALTFQILRALNETKIESIFSFSYFYNSNSQFITSC